MIEGTAQKGIATEPIGWEVVIADAEEQIRAAKQRVVRLKASVQLFKKKMAAGEPLPSGLKKLDQPKNI